MMSAIEGLRQGMLNAQEHLVESQDLRQVNDVEETFARLMEPAFC